MVSGNIKGSKWRKPQYILKYLDCDDDIPVWHDHECPSYAYMIDLLKAKYNLTLTRDILQNICLNRNNKQKFYPNIKVIRISNIKK